MPDAGEQFKLGVLKDAKEWDRAVDASPQGSIFCKSFFLNSLETDYVCYVVFLKEKKLAGVCVLLDENNLPRIAPYVFGVYEGFMFFDTEKDNHSRVKFEFEISEFLIKELLKKYNKLSICHSYNYKDLRAFQWYNYNEPEKSRFKIDLRYTGILNILNLNFDEYLKNIRKCRKQEYQYALSRYKVTVRESDDVEALDNLHKLTLKRSGGHRTALESNLLKKISLACLKNKKARLLIAFKGTKEISANLFIFDDKRGYYLFGANHPGYRDTGASTYLLLEQIKYCMSKGLKEVDFIGVNSPNRGDYKLSFNGRLEPYFETHFNI